MDEYKVITKKELKVLLDSFPDDEEFKVIKTNLGVTIIPIGEKILNKEEVLTIAEKSKTMILSSNKFISQVDMHSMSQDIYNIKKNGILNTLLVPKQKNVQIFEKS